MDEANKTLIPEEYIYKEMEVSTLNIYDKYINFSWKNLLA